MARVKRAVNAHKKRREILEQASGLPGSAFPAVPQGQGAGRSTRWSTPTATAAPARVTSASCGSSGSTPRPGRRA